MAIVGAGPAGATCAWYLAKGDIRVALIDKAKFPRDKFCGDAVIPRAQRHLQRMGVLDQLVEAGQCLFTTSGGFVSPSGIECLSDSAENPSGTPMSVKRIILDERIVRAAQSAGAKLLEEMPVDKITFDERFSHLDDSRRTQKGRSPHTGPCRWRPIEARALARHREGRPASDLQSRLHRRRQPPIRDRWHLLHGAGAASWIRRNLSPSQ